MKLTNQEYEFDRHLELKLKLDLFQIVFANLIILFYDFRRHICVPFPHSFGRLGFTLFTILMEGFHNSTDAIIRVNNFAHIVYELGYVGISSLF